MKVPMKLITKIFGRALKVCRNEGEVMSGVNKHYVWYPQTWIMIKIFSSKICWGKPKDFEAAPI